MIPKTSDGRVLFVVPWHDKVVVGTTDTLIEHESFEPKALEKEIQFILALDALKKVNRRNFNLDDSRRENTAEHSWQIVVFAEVLLPYAKDKDKIDL